MASHTQLIKHNLRSGVFLLRHLTILLLGIASGLPLALSASTLQTWFASTDASKLMIANIGLLGLPYIFKFCWAPIMDRFSIGNLGRRRGWIRATQLCLVLTIAAMAWLDPSSTPAALFVFGFACAFFSASQDIAIDAYRAELLPDRECGLGAALATTGYRIGMLVSGAFALIWADHYGWHSTYLLMALIMSGIALLTLLAPKLTHTEHAPHSLREAILNPFIEFFSRERAWSVILFLFLFKVGEAFTANGGGIVNTFLLRECHLTLTEIGIMNKVVGLSSVICGIFAGGVILLKVRLEKALQVFILLQALTNLGYVVLAHVSHHSALIITVISMDNFAAGLGNTAIVAFLMQICNQRYTATQFAALTAIAVVGRVILAPVAGLLLETLSWTSFFIWTFLLALPAYPVLMSLRRHSPQWFRSSYRH